MNVSNVQMNVTLADGWSLYFPSGGTVPIYSYIQNDNVGVLVNSPFTLLNSNAGGSYYLNGGRALIGSFTNSCLNPLTNWTQGINLPISFVYAGNRITIPGALLFEEGKIYLLTYGEPNLLTEPFYVEIVTGSLLLPRIMC